MHSIKERAPHEIIIKNKKTKEKKITNKSICKVFSAANK